MVQRHFMQCDVFSQQPTRGNALAVVLDGEGLTDAQMQEFAAWTNLAETTFVFRPTVPDADYHVRIFTTEHEMPFAGHPTLGTCAAWLKSGGRPSLPGVVRQQCGVGIVEIHIDREVPAFRAPPTVILDLPGQFRLNAMNALGIADGAVLNAARLDNGPVWNALELATAEEVLHLNPTADFRSVDVPIGVFGTHQDASEARYEVRVFVPGAGMVEDPVTGSFNAALAHWLQSQGRIEGGHLVHQGAAVNRAGRIHVNVDNGDVFIGGETSFLIEGTVDL
ncbi:PhzF family phenazine biosynthesis protein [Amaricoccus tamworthensis]|uniref:PhzF family phenazine biosynthesis protein n=1 Tax=Amaricoccus tamworthensis TaxID=57002 RepID=UPI003C7A35FD